MKTEYLCQLILDELDSGTMPFYRDTLLIEPLESLRDPLWQAAASLMRKLDSNAQNVVLGLMRQAAVDASATILGAIDGNTSLGERFVELSLTDGDGKQHSGELQDEFVRQANKD
jgi:hypothetical protein